MEQPLLSVVIPVYNEAESIPELHKILIPVLQDLKGPFELIFVDDGSQDGTDKILQNLSSIRLIRMRRNYGQTAALAIGIKESRGEIIVTMDGDLENDPKDIPKLLAKLNEGYEIVSGWRKDRWQKQWFTRHFPSAVANRIISLVTRVRLHDHGCTLKMYRRHILKNLQLTGDMHRMIAAYAAREGARVTEVPVLFHSRKFGKSKYGFSRTFKVLLDILAFHFFYKYGRRPMHFFGALGFFSISLAGLTTLFMVYLRIFEGTHFIRTPLPILVSIFTLVGFQFILMGLLAEIISRTFPWTIEYEEKS